VYQLPACVADLDLMGDVREEGINQENIAYILGTSAAGSCGPSISHARAYITRTKIQPRKWSHVYISIRGITCHVWNGMHDKSDNLLLRPQTSGRVCDLDAEHLCTKGNACVTKVSPMPWIKLTVRG
jgi:hypothetical protein